MRVAPRDDLRRWQREAVCVDECALCGEPRQQAVCEPFSDPEGICQAVRDFHELGNHAGCRPRDCAWRAGTGQAIQAAAVQALADSPGHALAVVGVGPQGDLVGLRTFVRAQQAKPYRTALGRRLNPEYPKAAAFVLCDEGHFI